MMPSSMHCRPFLPLRRHWFAAAASALLLVCRPVSSAPVDYLVDVWNTEAGLPSSTVTSVAQTPDGYLWVGTYNGLARFDGSRFVIKDPVSTPELTQARVQALYLDATGTLWINTYRGGLTSYRDGVFRQEWPDQATYDLHTTLADSTTNQVTFVTQYGEVVQHDITHPIAPWKIFLPPAGTTYSCTDHQNRLWFLTQDHHILIFEDGLFKPLPDDGGLAGSQIYTLVADARGQVWAGAENEIAQWDGTQFQAMTPTNGESDITPHQLMPMRSGALWVLDGDRMRKMSGRAWVDEISEWRGLLGPASGRAMGVHEDYEGGLWLNHYGNGLFYIAPNGQPQRFTTRYNLPPSQHLLATRDYLPSDRVNTWFQSSDGGMWIGLDRGGLAHLRDRLFHSIGSMEGLASHTAFSVCGDTNGTVWIGTAGMGLCRLTNNVITRYPVGASASANIIFSISPRADGGAWLSAAEGEDLYQYSGGEIRRVSWDVHGIKSILTDHLGRVWMGTKYGIAYTAGGNQRILGTNNNTSLPAVRALAETPDGQVWAGDDNGTIFRCDPDKLTPFHAKDALAEQPIYSLVADADGTLWGGTFGAGLIRFKNGQFSRITASQGFPMVVISQILDDHQGRLWLGTHQGIYVIGKSALNACADNPTNTLDYIVYGRHDGMVAEECSDGYQPACWRGADGKLWFTTVLGGAIWVNPKDAVVNPVPPPVIIEDLKVNGESIDLHAPGPVIIPPGHKQLDFQYTALSYDAGDKSRFRYRLEPLDTEWNDADTRRSLQLRNLDPREYHFHVIACNSAGIWNETGATVDFIVRPYFYQTFTFRVASGLILIAGLSFGVRRAATRKYRRKLAQMEQQHAIERDRARIAKDIHDDVGAGLTQITLLTELARREPDQVAANLERISDSARILTKAMDEIVWAVDPQHDTLTGLIDYISAYAEDFLRVASVRCRMELPVNLPASRVDAELRYNLFLALKEALNNIVKHANATEVWIRLRLAEKTFTLVVEDNGHGLGAKAGKNSPSTSLFGDPSPRFAGRDGGIQGTDRLSSGSGLENMKKRLAAVGGRCEIMSSPEGTRVEMTAAIQPVTSPVMVIGQDDPVE